MTDKTIPLTQYGYDILSKKRKELTLVLKKKSNNSIERQREVNAAKKELAEIDEIFNDAYIRPFDENNPVQVQIGCTVVLENLNSGDKREYKIMTRTTSEPLKGVISNESPLAQKMLGLKLGNTFKFRDNYGKEDNFKVYSIE
jgi:transcription elongation factor GreA